ncbi:MAG: isochorismatase family protein [Steroidobacteraceae bacterium]
MAIRPGSQSALVVVDVQVGVVAPAWERQRFVGNVALAVRRARDAGIPVVWVQHHDEELLRDTPAWQWVPELEPRASELRIYKSHNSAFENTELSSELDRLAVSRILLAGAATNWCIRATAYGALERGYDLTLLSDAHMTRDTELESGRILEARSMIDDLNVTIRWLSYPGRTNSSVPVEEATFA